MSKIQIWLCASWILLLAAAIARPSASVSIAIIVTAIVFLLSGDDDQNHTNDGLALEQAKTQQELNELKSKVSQLSLAAGLKNLKKND